VTTAVVRSGGVPQHIAIIMDGNRRFAKQMQLQRIEGHVRGFDKLKEVWWWRGPVVHWRQPSPVSNRRCSGAWIWA
jgi:hypothetical protein